MSTREIAYHVLDTLSEEKLQAFITLFADKGELATEMRLLTQNFVSMVALYTMKGA